MKQPAALDLIQNKPWAVMPAKLDEIDAFIGMRLRGEKLSDTDIELLQGKSGPQAEDPAYELLDGGVALIPVYGTITKRANIMTRMSGGTSAQLLQRNIKAAFDDPIVSSIVLDVESPGGSVDGTKEVADYLFSKKGTKPVLAYANGLMASAAYYISAAADHIMTGPAAQVGSIGIALTHYDLSKADEQAGVKRTVLSAGKYKRIASDEKPLTAEGQDYLQQMLDTYYSQFVDDVAKYRGVTADKVLEDMADGRIFIGAAAVAAGLADSVGTINDAIKLSNKEGNTMEYEKLKTEHAELFSQVMAEGAATVDVAAAVTAAVEAATAAERTRVTEIMALAGPEAVKVAAVADGKSVVDTLKDLNGALATQRAAGVAELAAAAPPSVGTQIETVKVEPELSVEDQAKKDFTEKAEIRSEFKTEGAYVSYMKAQDKGLVKVFEKK